MRPSIGLPTLILSISATTFLLAGCGKSQQGPEAMSPADTAQADAAAQLAAAKAAEEAKAAELVAREQELAARESDLKVKELEAELAKSEAETAAAKSAAASAKAAAAKKTPAKSSTSTYTTPKTAAVASPIYVPAGTQLAIELTSPISTKTNLVGDQVQGRLTSDVVVDGRRAAKAGATVHGSVTQVVSGSKKVGGTPVIGLTFDSLVAANGSSVSINAPYSQVGKSETARDTAKIVGGAAAGAIIGHQVDDDKGSVIGGILGGAAGTAAAHKTGGEVTLAAGQVVTVATGSAFEVRP